MIDEKRINRLARLCNQKRKMLGKINKTSWSNNRSRHTFIVNHREIIRKIILSPDPQAELSLSGLTEKDKARAVNVISTLLCQAEDIFLLLEHSSKMTRNDDLFLAGFLHNLRPDEWWWKNFVADLYG